MDLEDLIYHIPDSDRPEKSPDAGIERGIRNEDFERKSRIEDDDDFYINPARAKNDDWSKED